MPTSTAAGRYDGLAEFHDLFMDQPWQRLRPLVTELRARTARANGRP